MQSSGNPTPPRPSGVVSIPQEVLFRTASLPAKISTRTRTLMTPLPGIIGPWRSRKKALTQTSPPLPRARARYRPHVPLPREGKGEKERGEKNEVGRPFTRVVATTTKIRTGACSIRAYAPDFVATRPRAPLHAAAWVSTFSPLRQRRPSLGGPLLVPSIFGAAPFGG